MTQLVSNNICANNGKWRVIMNRFINYMKDDESKLYHKFKSQQITVHFAHKHNLCLYGYHPVALIPDNVYMFSLTQILYNHLMPLHVYYTFHSMLRPSSGMNLFHLPTLMHNSFIH